MKEDIWRMSTSAPAPFSTVASIIHSKEIEKPWHLEGMYTVLNLQHWSLPGIFANRRNKLKLRFVHLNTDKNSCLTRCSSGRNLSSVPAKRISFHIFVASLIFHVGQSPQTELPTTVLEAIAQICWCTSKFWSHAFVSNCELKSKWAPQLCSQGTAQVCCLGSFQRCKLITGNSLLVTSYNVG